MSLLFLSGLRREEGINLTWHDGPFHLDVSGNLPAFVIRGCQKSGKHEIIPCVPDFVLWLRETYPDAADLAGRVITLVDPRTSKPLQPTTITRIVEKIAEKAKVKVGTRMKWEVKVTKDKKTGEEKKERKQVEVPIFAGCHSLRRGFGSKWARKVSPAVLQKLMRHSEISTTMKFYVHLDAADLGQELWKDFGPAGENRGFKGRSIPKPSPKTTEAPDSLSSRESGASSETLVN